jgi:hypothetical protein
VTSIRPKLAHLRRLFLAAWLVLLTAHPVAALDHVSLQLKWKHQFQFAGYYAALEQGFYREAGLDVTIREGGPGIDVVEAVAGSEADFGVCSASVLREWTMGRRLVVLAAIFQRSPAVILVARRADISRVSDLRGRTLMDTPGSDEISAMLKHEGVDYEALPRVAHGATLRVAREGEQIASSAMMATNRRALEIQERLWNEATAAAASSPQVVPTGLFIESLNDVIDTFERRLHAGRDRVPRRYSSCSK